MAGESVLYFWSLFPSCFGPLGFVQPCWFATNDGTHCGASQRQVNELRMNTRIASFEFKNPSFHFYKQNVEKIIYNRKYRRFNNNKFIIIFHNFN